MACGILAALFPYLMNPLYSFSLYDPMYALAAPVALLFVFVIVMIAALLMQPHAHPEVIAKATLCYVMKGFALVLMGISLMPFIYFLLIGTLVPMDPLLALAVIFAMGAGLFVHFSRVSHTLEEVSVVIPRAIFHVGCEALGGIIAITSGLAIIVTFLITKHITGWAIPATTLILGILLMTSFSIHARPRKASSPRPAVKRKS